jgi:hypothetical protein
MHIEGSLERLLNSVLPHEVTHTVFAYHFRQPVPRWADEGGAVLSEDDVERARHDTLVRQILNTPGRAIPLRRLFALKEYPSDVMSLYAQGFSVTNFLVNQSSKPAFLNFVAQGMRDGWDRAVQTHYRYQSVEELEQTWLQHLRDTKRQAPALLARDTRPTAPPPNRDGRPETPTLMVRQTVPPAQPLLEGPQPVYRGASPTEDEIDRRPRQAMMGSRLASQDAWQPAPAPVAPAPSGGVRLGAPEYYPPSSPGRPVPPNTGSPAGYPH